MAGGKHVGDPGRLLRVPRRCHGKCEPGSRPGTKKRPRDAEAPGGRFEIVARLSSVGGRSRGAGRRPRQRDQATMGLRLAARLPVSADLDARRRGTASHALQVPPGRLVARGPLVWAEERRGCIDHVSDGLHGNLHLVQSWFSSHRLDVRRRPAVSLDFKGKTMASPVFSAEAVSHCTTDVYRHPTVTLHVWHDCAAKSLL